MKYFYLERGYIALISILIVSTLLLTTTLSLAQFGLAQRFFLLDSENKKISEELAFSCIEIAQLYDYSHHNITDTTAIEFPVGNATCTIISIIPSDNEKIILVEATHGESLTQLEVLLDATTSVIISWREI